MKNRFLKIWNKNWKIKSFKAFTLIEIVVASTIFSIMMISVIFIFVNSSEISAKTDINRSMQENIKNVIETIAEDIRNNWIRKCDTWIVEWCVDFNQKISNSNELWVWDNHYYIAKKDDISWSFIKVTSSDTICTLLPKQCFIVKNWEMLSNSSVKIDYINFAVFNDYIPKVSVNLIMKPMIKKWVKIELIKNNELNYQTVISERYIKR